MPVHTLLPTNQKAAYLIIPKTCIIFAFYAQKTGKNAFRMSCGAIFSFFMGNCPWLCLISARDALDHAWSAVFLVRWMTASIPFLLPCIFADLFVRSSDQPIKPPVKRYPATLRMNDHIHSSVYQSFARCRCCAFRNVSERWFLLSGSCCSSEFCHSYHIRTYAIYWWNIVMTLTDEIDLLCFHALIFAFLHCVLSLRWIW